MEDIVINENLFLSQAKVTECAPDLVEEKQLPVAEMFGGPIMVPSPTGLKRNVMPPSGFAVGSKYACYYVCVCGKI